MAKGFCYLVADYGLGKQKGAVLAALEHAGYLVLHRRHWKRRFPSMDTPQIFNTDQGSQFTSEDFTGTFSKNGIKISMDGQGRWMDNVFIERLWKSVKYEDIYLKAYGSVLEVRRGLMAYFNRLKTCLLNIPNR